ncbi:ABC transporter permease [Rhizohabitans arisaemae]|uniref:ABC transporter permease n=1 Tax=Rhizohabitans arisaemae TaxID=2720610 RepID=UPI0024B1E11C|nr:ABC transporter permease [Rhizohabitans arisaemae]
MTSLAWGVHDAWVVTLRHLRHIPRVPQLLFFSAIQPVLFLLLFSYVFSGSIHVPGIDYKVFMVPGTFIQTMAFAAAATSVGLADDLQKGFIDRFRSLPMARSAVLVGRIVSDATRNLLVILIMATAAHLIGFRFVTGVLPALAGLGLLMLFSFAFSCIGAAIGLAVRKPEAAQMAATFWMFPMIFASSAFVPLATLPGWMRVWAEYSPVTATVDALRALFFGYGDPTRPVLIGLAWYVALAAICLPLAVRSYRRAAM